MAATERAYDFTKTRILDGRFPGGKLISEAEVAAEIDLSRTPVREAFVRLQSEGLLELYPKRGALVVPVSAQEVETVMEARLLIERFAVEKVIRNDLDLTRSITKIIERQERLAERRSLRRFVDADRRFHRVFVEAAGNPVLLDLHDSMRDRQERMNLLAITRDDERLAQVLRQHHAIRAAVAERDLELARTELEEHLAGTLALLRNGSYVT
jgi:DNA-binding GntR family transcriptional regulator